MSEVPHSCMALVVAFSPPARFGEDVQRVIEGHIRHGWEFIQCRRARSDSVWSDHVLVFRRRTESIHDRLSTC